MKQSEQGLIPCIWHVANECYSNPLMYGINDTDYASAAFNITRDWLLPITAGPNKGSKVDD